MSCSPYPVSLTSGTPKSWGGMRSTFTGIIAIFSLGAVVACGQNLPEQSVLGAGAGVGAALVLSGGLAAGALVGAAGNVAYCKANPGKCR